jgi:hypothetical protein
LKVFPSSINMVNSALLGETLTSMDVYCNRIVLE